MSSGPDNYEAGIAALGVLDGAGANQSQALAYFKAATDLDARMCDAWLGRILCGDHTSATIYKAWRSSDQMHAQVSRMGINPSQLWPKFDIGMGIIGLAQPIYDRSSLAASLAQTLAMSEAPDYPEAIDTLNEATATAVTEWVRIGIYYRAQRWPDIIETVTTQLRLFDKDAVLKVAAELTAGIAHAYLGEFDEATNYLQSVTQQAPILEGQLDAKLGAVPVAQWFLAMIAREHQDEDAAQTLLGKVVAESPSPEVRAAMSDASVRLQVTTREAIDDRTDIWDPATGPSANDVAEARAAEAREELLAEATAELDSQIGMYELRDQIRTFRSRMRMAEKRRELGLKTPAATNHMVFVGPPGTGKTSIARVIAKILCGLGIVANSNVVEKSAKDLIGEHIGASEANLRKAAESALDGTFFLDEAYALVSADNKGSNADSFGKAVVDGLLTILDNWRDRLVVIIAGYERDIDHLLSTNDGMRSRFAHRFRFDTYTPDELVSIAGALGAKRDDILHPEAVETLRAACQRLSTLTADGGHNAIDMVGNGRFIRKVLENAADYRDLRNDENPPEVFDEQTLMTIHHADIQGALRKVLAAESTETGANLATIVDS